MINKVILVGNVGSDPDVRTLETGTKVARVRIATTERIFNRQSQESKDHTEWHSVVFWRGMADVVDKYVRKGNQIYVEGALRSNEWTDKEGNKRYGVEIVANELKLLGGRREGGAPASSAATASTPAPAAAPAPVLAEADAAPEPPIVEDDPDDLPF